MGSLPLAQLKINIDTQQLYPFQFKFQFYALPFASCIQRKRNLRVTSKIRRTRPPLRNYNYVIPRTKWRLERSTAPYSSYTAAPRRTAPGPSNLCPSYLTTLVTIHSSYGCLVKRVQELESPPATSEARPTTSEGAWAFFFQIMPIRIHSIFLSL